MPAFGAAYNHMINGYMDAGLPLACLFTYRFCDGPADTSVVDGWGGRGRGRRRAASWTCEGADGRSRPCSISCGLPAEGRTEARVTVKWLGDRGGLKTIICPCSQCA